MNDLDGVIHGLIFDVDGVIADTEAVNAEASIQVFRDLFGVSGVARRDFEAGLGRGAEEYVRAAARVHGLELSPDQVARATRARQDNFLALLKARPVPPFPGVLELMDAALARSDFRVAIATSSTREKSEAVLRSARVPFDRMAYVTGNDVTHKKPHPELFLAAASRIGVAPSSCVVVEDAPNGVESAHSAGARCIAVTNTVPSGKLKAADVVVKSLEEVSVDTILGLLGRS